MTYQGPWNLLPRAGQDIPWICTLHGWVTEPTCNACHAEHAFRYGDPPVPEFSATADARWTADHEAATCLRNTITRSWIKMLPPVPFHLLIDGTWWEQFHAWCVVSWDLGHLDVPELIAGGSVFNERAGWGPEVAR